MYHLFWQTCPCRTRWRALVRPWRFASTLRVSTSPSCLTDWETEGASKSTLCSSRKVQEAWLGYLSRHGAQRWMLLYLSLFGLICLQHWRVWRVTTTETMCQWKNTRPKSMLPHWIKWNSTTRDWGMLYKTHRHTHTYITLKLRDLAVLL